ncbi:hypothetical protein TrLO_g15462 [Triparma laevis f. longispina]|uniref:Uncharacterized protein n=1 Tax=Triparma laevis f. longispina TaxID=1714387 RepID=A0A9W7CE60_9STRA|nr:hypothetical protein TrLO_g15462 [Triparma laevis f. longispina]
MKPLLFTFLLPPSIHRSFQNYLNPTNYLLSALEDNDAAENAGVEDRINEGIDDRDSLSSLLSSFSSIYEPPDLTASTPSSSSPLPSVSFDPPTSPSNDPSNEYDELYNRKKGSSAFERALRGETSVYTNDWNSPSPPSSSTPETLSPPSPPSTTETCPSCSSLLTPLDTLYISKYSICQSCRSLQLQKKFADANTPGINVWDVRRMARGGDEVEGWKKGGKVEEKRFEDRRSNVSKPRIEVEFGEEEEDLNVDVSLVQFGEGEGDNEEEDEDAEYNYVRWLEEELEESRTFVRILLRRVDRLEGRKKEKEGKGGKEKGKKEKKEKWEKVRDEETGGFFFMNPETGEQRWEIDN